MWAHQGPIETGAVDSSQGHESRKTESLFPRNAHNPDLPQASHPQLPSTPLPQPPAGNHTSYCSPAVPPRQEPPPMRHWGWEGHSGRRRWARRAHPGSAGQGGSGSLGWGVGRTSTIRLQQAPKGSLVPSSSQLGVQSVRLMLEHPPPLPSPHLTCSLHCFHCGSTGRGRSSPPCVGTTPGSP